MLRGGEHAAGVEQRLVRHQQAARALLGQRDRRRQVRVDALAVAGQLRQLLLHGLLLLEARLAHVVQRGADHQVGQAHVALHVRERAVAVQRGADVGRRARVAVEEDVLPRDLDVVEDDQRVDLVEAVRDRIVGRPARGPRSPVRQMCFMPARAHVDDEADRVLGQLRVAPVGDRRLREGLVGVGRGGLVLRAAHDDAVVGLAHDVQQHVGVLILRALGAVALRIGVGGDVERDPRAARAGCAARCCPTTAGRPRPAPPCRRRATTSRRPSRRRRA